jgi:drug/metabolite transporter (DMT)-like permease
MARLSPAMKGILCIVIAMSMLTVSDAIVRGVTERVPLMALILLRSVTAVIPVLVMLHLEGAWRGLRTPYPFAQLARGGLIIASYSLYLMALTGGLSFALAVALVFTSPLFVALLSPIAIGERVTPARWLATLIGFSGVLVALRPWEGSFPVVALYSLASGLCYALSSLLARRLGASEPAAVTSAYTWFMFLAGSAPFALFGSGSWQLPGSGDLGLIALVGLIAGSAHFLIVAAYRHAPATVVAPFEYVAMLWGTLFGFLFWHETPGIASIAGMALIVAGGLVIVYGDRAR